MALIARGSPSRYQRSRFATDKTHWRGGNSGQT
jgi:hypothetical protein